MKKLFYIAFFLIFSLPLWAGDRNEELFFSANQLYKEGKYQEALEKYLELEKLGVKSGHLYYNAGNACFRLKTIGYAVLYYERARILLPRDEDLDYNLKFVRNMTKDVIEKNDDILSMVFFWLDSVTLREVFTVFIIINIAFWISLTVRIFIKEEWAYYLVIVALVLWIVSGSSFGKKWYDIAADNRAVILSEETDVLSGPDSGDTVLFKLHEGTVVNYEREEAGWYLISLPDNKRGWVDGKAAALIRQNR